MTISRSSAAMILLVLAASTATAAGPDLLQEANLKTLGCAPPDTKYVLAGSSQPGNVFYPGDAVDLKIKVTRGEQALKSVTLEVIEIAMRQNKYLEGWSIMSRPTAVENLGPRGKVDAPVAVDEKPGAAGEIEVKNLPVPPRYGTYLVTIAPNGRQPQFLCTLLRAHRPKQGFDISAPVFGEGQFLTHDSQKPELVRQRAQTLSRLGIKGIRIELGWRQNENGEYPWEGFDVLMNALKEAKIKTLVTMGGHPGWTTPFGQPTPACIEEKPDHSCSPKHYEAFGKFIRAFCQRYWEGGQGSLWAIEHWNEPWEGISISGWESDSNHYRALMKQIAENARAVDSRIRTAAACSIMNTEDKFFAGEDRDELAKLVDVFTDHYVPPRTSYGPMVAKHWGKESTDTESWIAANELLLPQVMCQFLACGQDRVTPWHPGMTYYKVPGSPMEYHLPHPVALATNVFNVFCTGRPFQRLLFLDHLPWAFQFGAGDDVVVVLLPRVMAYFGSGQEDVLWWQFNLDEGGTLSIDNDDGAMELYDVAGNREFEGKKQIVLPVDYLPHYLRAPNGGVDLIAKRLAAAQFAGVRPVRIMARDFTRPVSAPGAAAHIAVHNLMNRPVKGTLTVTPPPGMTLKSVSAPVGISGGLSQFSSDENGTVPFPRATVIDSPVLRSVSAPVELAAGQTADLEFPIATARPSPANAYTFSYDFQSSAGKAQWKETLHVLVARKGAKKIDGDLSDWDKDLGVIVTAGLQKADPTAQVWRPFLEFKDAQPDGSFAELKMAYDDEFLYVAARVHDPSDYAGHQRLENRDESQYFRSAKDDAICESLRPYEKFVTVNMRDKARAEKVKSDPQWAEYEKFLEGHPDAKEAVKTRAAAVYFEAKRRNPAATFADAYYVYKKVPWSEFPWQGDSLQFGFDVIDGYAHHKMKTDEDRVPAGFHAMPDTDYEYAAYACTDGGSELWRLLAPGVPRKHYYPRQPRSKVDQGPVKQGKHVVRREGKVTAYEVAVPWSELKEWKPRAGQTFGFTFRVNNNQGPALLFGAGRSATKTNGLSLHPYWEGKPSCGIRWALGEADEQETDPKVLKKLDQFQDWKFGLFMHWGIYSQWGCIESWPLVEVDKWARPDDLPAWVERNKDFPRFLRDYQALNTTFHPKKFDPQRWADAAKAAGMKYVVFTTKHHDGFCMFDTRQTEYRTTHGSCPLHADPRADVVKAVFDTFRKAGFGVGAYYSKSDWRHPGYWAPDWPHPDRNVNYDTAKYPERWAGFVKFTHGLVEELMTGYGPIDILWLDGGQVRPPSQDIDMPRLAELARKRQPGLIIVDRTVGGRYENYRTPEQEVPEKALPYVWETCMTMGDQWSFKPNDNYKSPRKLIHLLADIVAKGGNFLLNVGPDADGQFAPPALERLEEIGRWMKVNGEAIHGTRPVAPYKEGRVCLTRKGDKVYLICLAEEGQTAPPAEIKLRAFRQVQAARMLGTSEPVEWTNGAEGVTFRVPAAARQSPPCQHAWTLEIVPGAK